MHYALLWNNVVILAVLHWISVLQCLRNKCEKCTKMHFAFLWIHKNALGTFVEMLVLQGRQPPTWVKTVEEEG